MRNLVTKCGIGVLVLAVVTILAGVGSEAAAQESDVSQLVESGRTSYIALCGSCHGTDAKGSGIIAPYLRTTPPDLTGIAARYQGIFPFEDMYDIVDGREIPGHGTRAMPVWGPALLGMDAEADKRVVKEKVVELVYFLKSIQPAVAVAPAKMGGDSN